MADYKKLLTDSMSENGISFTEMDEHTLKIVYSGEEMRTITVIVTFEDDGSPVARFNCWDIARVRPVKRTPILALCNSLNAKMLWVRFFIDRDGEVAAKLDAAFTESNCADVCLGMIRILVSIVDESYPQIMKALWADDDAQNIEKRADEHFPSMISVPPLETDIIQ